MFRLWGKVYKNGHMTMDTVIEIEGSELTRTMKVFEALRLVCEQFDLAVPIWLDSTVNDFKRHAKCRFTQDNFIEHIDFDCLEISMLEEDPF